MLNLLSSVTPLFAGLPVDVSNIFSLLYCCEPVPSLGRFQAIMFAQYANGVLKSAEIIHGVPTEAGMATITERVRADGSKAYRAQIVIKRSGKIIHRESETFDNRSDATLWAARRESALGSPGGVEAAIAKQSDVTLGELITLYEKRMKPLKSWGKTKQGVFNLIKESRYANDPVSKIDSGWVIDYCIARKTEGNIHKSTVNQDYAFMRSVFSVAKDVLKVPVSTAPFDEARPTLKKLDLVGKSDERDRRPAIDEMTDIMRLAVKSATLKRRNNLPIDKLILFQMFSARRISETCRIEWADLTGNKVIVRNMKDPSRKQGNDVQVLLPDEALLIIESMPRVDRRIFPFNPKTVETRFSRLRDKAGYYTGTPEDLRLHDLRHECLSYLAEKNGLAGENWDIPRMQLVSGHRNWNVLQRYVNLLTEAPHDRWKDWEYRPQAA